MRVVSFVGTGVESYVEMDEARASDVTVCNVPRYGANAVAEHALALALAVARRVADGDRAVRAGSWGQTEGVELYGRRLGVVGAGPIGARMIELGRGLGMTVVCWTRRRTPDRERELGAPIVELDHLFATADVVSLHLAHTPETEGIVNRRLLSMLRPHAIVVNTARGALVDETALVELLEAGSIGGAGLDVLGSEPPPADPCFARESDRLRPWRAAERPRLGQLLSVFCSYASAIASISTRIPLGSPAATVARAGGVSPTWRR